MRVSRRPFDVVKPPKRQEFTGIDTVIRNNSSRTGVPGGFLNTNTHEISRAKAGIFVGFYRSFRFEFFLKYTKHPAINNQRVPRRYLPFATTQNRKQNPLTPEPCL
jgi:hypothetical protein